MEITFELLAQYLGFGIVFIGAFVILWSGIKMIIDLNKKPKQKKDGH